MRSLALNHDVFFSDIHNTVLLRQRVIISNSCCCCGLLLNRLNVIQTEQSKLLSSMCEVRSNSNI